MNDRPGQSIQAHVFMQQLNEAIRAQGIESEGWRLLDSGDAIERRYAFKDFRSGFSFMTHMALFSERLDHHPTWTQDYNTLGVILHTHDLGGLSHLDLLWAIEAERVHYTNFMTLG